MYTVKDKRQYHDDEELGFMLPSDMTLLHDKDFHPYTVMYHKDSELFFNDFAKAYAKLLA